MDLTGKKNSEDQGETLNCLTAINETSDLKEKVCSVQLLFLPLIPAETALKYLQMLLQAQQMLPQHLCYSLHDVYYDEYHLRSTVNIYANYCICKKTDTFQWPQHSSLLYDSYIWTCINPPSQLSSFKLQIYLTKGLLKAIGNSCIEKSKSNAKNVKVKQVKHMKFYLRAFFFLNHIIILKDTFLVNHMFKRSHLHCVCSFGMNIWIQTMVAMHAVAYAMSQYGFRTLEGIHEN